MKESEYFQKAFRDADYRQAKITELRDHARFTFGLVLGFVAVAAACRLYVGIVEHRWPFTFDSMWGSCILMAWVYTNTKTRLAALEAMHGKQPEPAPSASGNLPA